MEEEHELDRPTHKRQLWMDCRKQTWPLGSQQNNGQEESIRVNCRGIKKANIQSAINTTGRHRRERGESYEAIHL